MFPLATLSLSFFNSDVGEKDEKKGCEKYSMHIINKDWRRMEDGREKGEKGTSDF